MPRPAANRRSRSTVVRFSRYRPTAPTPVFFSNKAEVAEMGEKLSTIFVKSGHVRVVPNMTECMIALERRRMTKSKHRDWVIFAVAVLVVGCWMDHSPLLNPPTGPGTPYPCVGHPTWNYCDDGTCCPDGMACKKNPDRCDEDPMPFSNDEVKTTTRRPASPDGGTRNP